MDKDGKEKRSKVNIRIGSPARFAAFTFLLGAVVTLGIVLLLSGRGRFLLGDNYKQYKEIQEKYGKYYEMEKAIEKNSLYDIDSEAMDKQMADAVLKSTGDKYAQYFTTDEYAQFERKFFDKYTGIGVAVTSDAKGNIIISRTLEKGPAAEAGIEAGDIVVSIDGKKPKTVDEASAMLAGETGSRVTLELKRGDDVSSYTLNRTEVEDDSVTFEEYDVEAGIGYIRISNFREGTTEELEDAIKYFTNKDYSSVIIDVRGNPGGITEEGIKAADLLLPACKIITIKDAKGKETVENSDESKVDVNYAVLIDGDTASAAEIFACAIKENGGGKVIGTKSYGKGLIQGIFELSDKSVIKFTIQEYFSPQGNKIDGAGVTPDIEASGDAALTEAANVLKG